MFEVYSTRTEFKKKIAIIFNLFRNVLLSTLQHLHLVKVDSCKVVQQGAFSVKSVK